MLSGQKAIYTSQGGGTFNHVCGFDKARGLCPD